MMIITVNSGSSSLKLAAYRMEQSSLSLLRSVHLQIAKDIRTDHINDFLADVGQVPITAVCHRVVHGGDKLIQPCLIDQNVEDEIHKLASLAPLHNPQALHWIRFFKQQLNSNTQHIAIFDTAYYHKLPEVAREYALPRKLCLYHNLHRYGFHGIAHQAMLQRYQDLQPEDFTTKKIITLQLGSGCSITASLGDKPQDTSMGFTPIEGLMMATRSGDIDPGLLCYLQKNLNYSTEQLEHILNHESGLLGVSTLSDDMQQLLASDLPSAKLAVDMYCYRIKKYIGAYAAVLAGVDVIIFSGGIGENSPVIREQILLGFQWINISLDENKNAATSGIEAEIHSNSSKTQVWVLPSDESVSMAKQAIQLMDK